MTPAANWVCAVILPTPFKSLAQDNGDRGWGISLGRRGQKEKFLRVDPDGKNLKPLAHNFRNEYESPVDSFGDVWASDNDDDGNQGCRLLWVMEGGSYGFFSLDGTRTWQNDRRPGQDTQTAHWHTEPNSWVETPTRP